MAKWTFEPGHTTAEFCARHMMVTHVREHFKDVQARSSSIRKALLALPSKSSSMRARSGPVSQRVISA
jgi:hypothetical protein